MIITGNAENAGYYPRSVDYFETNIGQNANVYVVDISKQNDRSEVYLTAFEPEPNTYSKIYHNKVDPFCKVTYDKHYNKILKRENNYYYSWDRSNNYNITSYYESYQFNYRHERSVSIWDMERSRGNNALYIPYIYADVTVEMNNEFKTTTVKFCLPEKNMPARFFVKDNLMVEITPSIFNEKKSISLQIYPKTDYYSPNIYNILQHYDYDIMDFWDNLAKVYHPNDNDGIKLIENKSAIKNNLLKLQQEKPTLFSLYNMLKSSICVDKISNNRLLAAFLTKFGDDYDKLTAELAIIANYPKNVALNLASPSYHAEQKQPLLPFTRCLCEQLPGANDKKKEIIGKAIWHARKTIAAQAEGLGIDKIKHSKLFSLIEEEKIPISIFHAPSNKDQPVNIEFDFLEKALKEDGWTDTLCEIAQNAARRTTYEKNITPYIAFLYKIEKYLKKHTNKSWKAMPKFVSSQYELEMDEANENGTAKKRSALTPIVDNENHIITIPYAALAISGVRTTYCYSLNYYVFEEGMIDPISDSPVLTDLEKKLNNRDDYGLMFYTLTGTSQNTGYPTFLIIFEKLKNKNTRVHFHRVHPNRSHNGITTQACNLIKECYRYMAGNIQAKDIEAQQGDIILIPHNNGNITFEDAKPIESFESHCFEAEVGNVILVENKSKSEKNRLGFIKCDSKFNLTHPEHEAILGVKPGIYEVRRCKSFEANPVAVWSYTVD